MSSLATRARSSTTPRRITLPVKVGLLSHVVPPAHSGQAVVLFRIFQGIDPDSYCLLEVVEEGAVPASEILSAGAHASERLPVRYHTIPARSCLPHYPRPIIRTVRKLSATLAETRRRAKHIREALDRENCQALIACSADLVNLPAGYLAARQLGIPFYPWLFDDYETQWIQRFPRTFARWAMRFLAPRAERVLVPNAFLAELVRNRHGIEPLVIANVCDSVAAAPPVLPWPACPDAIRVVYTGAVYQAHFDAFRNLQTAVGILRKPAEIHVWTNCPHEMLEREGLASPTVIHDAISLAESLEEQRRADILFLPLAFNSPYPEVIRTANPGKVSEFLASGRPILVHAPGDSFVSWYFRKHDCGLVVDRPEAGVLADALDSLMTSPSLRTRIVSNAWSRAQADYHPGRARELLASALNRKTK